MTSPALPLNLDFILTRHVRTPLRNIGHHTRGRAVIDGMLKDSGSALEQNPASITIVETLDLLLEHLALVSCPLQYDDTSDLVSLRRP